MSIRRVHCPRCRTAANIPAAMATVRCASCGSIWNPNETEQAQEAQAEAVAAGKSKSKSKTKKSKPKKQSSLVKMVGALCGAVLGIALIAGGIWYLRQPDSVPTPAAAFAQPKPPAQQSLPVATEPFREIDLPESTRQQIYRDYRTAKGSAVGQPIPMPKEWASRKAVDATLGNIVDRELTLHASIHNIQVDDVVEIIKEGNAKAWN